MTTSIEADLQKSALSKQVMNSFQSSINVKHASLSVLKNQIVKTWQNADGDYEEADMSGFLEKMEKDYLELKENIRKNYK